MLPTMYEVVPDVFDFAVLSSTARIERPGNSSNFTAGVHSAVKIDYAGIGRDPIDYSEAYYSRRLLAVTALDDLRRGWLSNNFVHALLHQWSAFLPFDLGMTDGFHYLPTTSAASLLGGMAWVDRRAGVLREAPEEPRRGRLELLRQPGGEGRGPPEGDRALPAARDREVHRALLVAHPGVAQAREALRRFESAERFSRAGVSAGARLR
ncbi:hypothetical protein WME94_20735 [Sorangium sp. So ce429]